MTLRNSEKRFHELIKRKKDFWSKWKSLRRRSEMSFSFKKKSSNKICSLLIKTRTIVFDNQHHLRLHKEILLLMNHRQNTRILFGSLKTILEITSELKTNWRSILSNFSGELMNLRQMRSQWNRTKIDLKMILNEKSWSLKIVFESKRKNLKSWISLIKKRTRNFETDFKS